MIRSGIYVILEARRCSAARRSSASNDRKVCDRSENAFAFNMRGYEGL